MKILLINKFHYHKGGSESYYFSLGEALSKKGHEVSYFSMEDPKNYECPDSKYFVKNASTDGGIISKLNMLMHVAYKKESYNKLMRLLKDKNPELVILNLIHKQLTLSVIRAIKDYNKDIKIVWTMHDLICACPSYTMLDGNNQICEKCLDGNFKHCIENRCSHGSLLMSVLSAYEAGYIQKHGFYNLVDYYITPSEFYNKKLKEANFTTKPIITIRNPLPLDTKYIPNYNSSDYFLYVGRLSKEKGILTLIDSMRDIDYKLNILGTGPLLDELRDYINKNKLTNVSLKGFVKGEELNDYVKNSRAVILPSEWYENGPYSAMEAMAFSKPLIVSSLGGLPELVINNKNGYIYNSKEELHSQLLKMISLTKDEYQKMSEESLSMARAMFDMNSYIDKLLKLIK